MKTVNGKTREQAIELAASFQDSKKAYYRIGNHPVLRYDEEIKGKACKEFCRLRREVIIYFGIKTDNYNGGRGLDDQQKAERYVNAETAARWFDKQN